THLCFFTDSPTSTLTVTPDSPVFTGERVNLKCVIETYSNWRRRNYQTYDWKDWTQEWRYEWYKGSRSSVKLQTSERYTVNRDTLSIVGAVTSDQGQYWCRGLRDGRPNSSQSSSAVSLSVKDSPTSTLTVTPDSPVFTGERVNLKCVIETYSNWIWRNYQTYDWKDWTQEWRYEWYKGSRSSVKLQTSERYTVNRDTLSIVGAVTSDQGQYWCRGLRDRRPNSSQSSSLYLSVKDSPTSTLTVTPDSLVFTGERVNLKCVIETYRSWIWRNYQIDNWRDWTQEWRYEWYKGSRSSVKLQTSERYTVNRDTLSIVGAVTFDQGQYWCRGLRDRRPNSSQSSSAVSLSVKVLPTSTLTVTPDNPVFTGERVNLKCVINSDHSDWRYEWSKGNSVLQASDRYTVNRNTLSIVEAVKSDEGQYTCKGHIDGRSVSSQSSSFVSLSVKALKPKPELTSDPAGAALTGNTVTLTCRMDPSTGYWDFYWYKHTLNPETEKRERNPYRLKIDSVSDGGQYWCRAGRGKPVYYTNYSDALWVNVTVSPKAVLMVRPDERVFRGETVTLRCDVKWGGDTEWTYRWEIEGTNNLNINSANRCTKQECCTSGVNKQKHRDAVSLCSTQELNISSVDHFHSGKYTCTGQMNTQISQRSDAVTLTVSDEAQAAVRVSPQPWLTEGESVTLICEVSGSSTGWMFSWFRDHDHLSDSSRGAGGSYTLSPAALQHTGVYTCRAERGRPAYYTRHSSTQPLWVTGVSASVSLVINPSRSQHFSSHSLSLSCEDQSNSAGWTVRRYTDKDTTCSTQTGSACVIESLSTSDTGVYWCQSESGEKRHPRNITVHDQHRNTQLTSDSNRSGESHVENSPLQPDINTAGPSDLTYAQINIQDKKKSKGKGKSSESGDSFYSELKHNTDKGERNTKSNIITVNVKTLTLTITHQQIRMIQKVMWLIEEV
ncbi:Fc receptor-like protein 5, partial [Anabarilius grahami]